MRVTFHGTLLAVILLLLAMMAIGPARQYYDELQAIHGDRAALAAGSAERQRLAAKLQDLNDPAYVEYLARHNLGYVRPGETTYVVPRPPPAAPTVPSPAASAIPVPTSGTAAGALGQGSLLRQLWAAARVVPLP
jgi:cell division protein FtsB